MKSEQPAQSNPAWTRVLAQRRSRRGAQWLVTCLLAACLPLVGACSDDDSPLSDSEEKAETEVEKGTATRTVVAYMVGDNKSSGASDLSSLLLANIDSMMVGMQDVTDGRLLVFSKLSTSDYSYLYRIKSTNGTVTADTLYTYSGINPLAYETMGSILSTAFSDYPAEGYGLIFASHGEGWVQASTSAGASLRSSDLNSEDDSMSAISPSASTSISASAEATDSSDGRLDTSDVVAQQYIGAYSSTAMDITDFRTALQASGQHLDFILWDACFMQSVEVAYELRDEVDYLIGSPTEIPGPGADYAQVTPTLFSTSSDYATEIAQAYYQPYADKYTGQTPTSNYNWTGGVSISVISSAGLDALATQSAAIFGSYAFDGTVSSIMRYDRRSTKYRYYYDLDGLMAYLTDEGDDYDSWREAFDAAVPTWLTTEMNYSSSGGMFSMSGAEGLSTYIPTSSTSSTTLAFYLEYEWPTDTGWGQ